MDTKDLKRGQIVYMVDERLNCGSAGDCWGAPESNVKPLVAQPMMVVIVQAVPGKQVGVALKQPFPGGHSCDGLVPQGHGWWVMAAQLYTEDEYKAHVAATAAWAKEQEAAHELLSDFID